MSSSARLGLELNPKKCQILVLGNTDSSTTNSILEAFKALAPGIKEIANRDAYLFGSSLSVESISSCR